MAVSGDSLKIAGCTAIGVAVPLLAQSYVDKDATTGNLVQVPYIGEMLGTYGSYTAVGGIVGGAVLVVLGWKGDRIMPGASTTTKECLMGAGVGLMTGGILSGYKPIAQPPATTTPPGMSIQRGTGAARVVQAGRSVQPVRRVSKNF